MDALIKPLRGKPTDKVIAETANLWAFAAKWTGLDVKLVH